MLENINEMGGASRVVDSIPALKALPATGSEVVFVLGYYTAGDGGGGTYRQDLNDTTTPDNKGSVIIGDDLTLRWKLCQTTPYTLKQFGCKGDAVTDDTAGYLACFSTGLPVHIPAGRYKVAPIGPITSYPGGHEPNRTSGLTLSTGQNITGEGESSELIWGSTTKQAFSRVVNARDIVISGVKFTGGYSAVIVDPVADGSVDSIGLQNCILDGQLIGLLGGRQYALDPEGSKYCSNIWMENCDLRNITVHGMVATNCYRPRATSNNFESCAGGFCIDFSQGSRGGVINNNTGNSVLHFCKVESSNINLNGEPLVTDSNVVASSDCLIYGNNVTGIQQLGIFFNSHTERLIATSNNLQGSFTVAISIGSVTGFAHDGQIIISKNIVKMLSTNAIGIRSQLNTPKQPPLIEGNSLTGGSIGVDWQTSRGRFIGNNIASINIGVQIGAAVTNIDLLNNDITATSAVAGVGTASWKGLRARGNTLNVTEWSFYLGTIAGLGFSEFFDNSVSNPTTRANGSLLVNNPSSTRFSMNSFNIPSASGSSIATIGSAMKCSLLGNIATVGFKVAGPDATTTAQTLNNITDASYVA
ncbi:right-handed parallel beta-helix repeat-containing protein [Pseudomonas chlororaphis]|uniref:Oxidoreductase n=1 Tax=Pseudomonas chlororaphis TaxID=587753 RepID=A0A1Q8EVG4_9PSED|nr:right-handed parallel beta-helix repeat-containing protein [Pseudomonas chlororaphis]OLF55785.1 oxidoreductase [Pseudomonas chlororaphis]